MLAALDSNGSESSHAIAMADLSSAAAGKKPKSKSHSSSSNSSSATNSSSSDQSESESSSDTDQEESKRTNRESVTAGRQPTDESSSDASGSDSDDHESFGMNRSAPHRDERKSELLEARDPPMRTSVLIVTFILALLASLAIYELIIVPKLLNHRTGLASTSSPNSPVGTASLSVESCNAQIEAAKKSAAIVPKQECPAPNVCPDCATECPPPVEPPTAPTCPPEKECPAMKECPAVNECPAVKECPTVKECPAAQDCPAVKECPAEKQCEDCTAFAEKAVATYKAQHESDAKERATSATESKSEASAHVLPLVPSFIASSHSPISPRLNFYFSTDGTAHGLAPTTPLPDTGRYIRTRIYEQFNNQRQAMLLTIHMAIALNRTVIMPPSTQSFRFAEVFDMALLGRIVPIITEMEYEHALAKFKAVAQSTGTPGMPNPLLLELEELDMKGQAGRDLWYLRKERDLDADQKAFFASTAGHDAQARFLLDEFDQDPPPEDPNAEKLIRGISKEGAEIDDPSAIVYPKLKRTLFQNLGWAFLPQTLAFPQNIQDSIDEQLSKHLAFHMGIWKSVGWILDSLAHIKGANHHQPPASSEKDGEVVTNDFYAIHWRQKDFYADLRFHPNAIINIIERDWKLPKKSVIYLGTDEFFSAECQGLLQTLSHPPYDLIVKTFKDFQPLIPLYSQLDPPRQMFQRKHPLNGEVEVGYTVSETPFIEQLVMAHAVRFLATPRSTYSEWVLHMRGWMKNPYAAAERKQFNERCHFYPDPNLGHRKPTPNATEAFMDRYNDL